MRLAFPRFVGVCVGTAFLLLTAHAQAAMTNLALTGQGGNPITTGFGYQGLFLGSGFFTSQLTAPSRNWAWDNVGMSIQDNGDATIAGTMTRALGSEQWGLQINLSDVEFRDRNGVFKDAGNYADGVTRQHLLDLAAGIDPFGNGGGGAGWGFEWKSLTMALTKDPSNPSTVPLTGWTGLAMPTQPPPNFHPLVAELHYDGPSKGLTFDAWYQNPHPSWSVGDTKAFASVLAPIPIPSAFWLFGTGLLGLFAIRPLSQRRSTTNSH